MRNTFVKSLTSEAQKNNKIILITNDLGFSVFEPFIQKFPRQFLNAGVSEQHMTGMAAGMAIEGFLPVLYSIIPFVTMRNFEQIRNDLCYQHLNVKIVGVGAGFSYGPYGHTHHSLEDIGILRTLPDMTILCPGDPFEVQATTHLMLHHDGPVYLRLGKSGEPNIHTKQPDMSIGHGILIQDGTELTVIATSTMLRTAAAVIERLNKIGRSTRFISMPCIKPLDMKLIMSSARKTKHIVTVEEHSIIGGLGSSVSEVLADNIVTTPLTRIAVPDRFTPVMGDQEFMRQANGLSEDQIFNKITNILKHKSL